MFSAEAHSGNPRWAFVVEVGPADLSVFRGFGIWRDSIEDADAFGFCHSGWWRQGRTQHSTGMYLQFCGSKFCFALLCYHEETPRSLVRGSANTLQESPLRPALGPSRVCLLEQLLVGF
jgi:hypothetical protein